MKVLITGGAGFIGSHLAEAYLHRGDEVFVIDDLSTGSVANVNHLQEDRRYKDKFIVTIDSVLNYDKMLELVGTCDLIFHLAAAVGVQYILDNPLSSIVTNVRGTETVLELCNKFRKKVLIASTSEVYGKHDDAPLAETDDCVYGPSTKSRWSYAASKLMDEFTGLAYYRTKKLPVLIVRFFNTVGPRQTGRYGMVIPRFVKQALRGEPISVYGDGTQTRTFTHVKNVVDALVKLVENPEAIGEVVNIGGAEEVSILSLAERIKGKTHSSSEITLVPYEEVFPPDFEDMQRRVPSTLKLQKLIGYSPKMDLDKILDDVIAYHRGLA
ncbi:NAD-dependent epimerase/dehydratase family protein [Candidatus Bathyarchaeota archaeon]|nr:MAG: NAD-dependent epimerase/dehydratase family protein [Candidatus Bathyarchaeota archaeon]